MKSELHTFLLDLIRFLLFIQSSKEILQNVQIRL